MNGLEFGDADVAITSVSFSPGMMEISFVERKDQSDFVSTIKTLLVDVRGARLTKIHDELVELLIDTVDAAMLVARNPEPAFESRRSKRLAGVDEDDE
jgi:hypothetical protein